MNTFQSGLTVVMNARGHSWFLFQAFWLFFWQKFCLMHWRANLSACHVGNDTSIFLEIYQNRISGMGELEMDSRPFPAPLPHGNPVPFPPPPVSRLRTTPKVKVTENKKCSQLLTPFSVSFLCSFSGSENGFRNCVNFWSEATYAFGKMRLNICGRNTCKDKLLIQHGQDLATFFIY